MTWTLDGKTCVVTGATDGIGKVTARRLAERGASVWIVGRNESKARDVVDEIRRETGREMVVYQIADLSEMAQVRELALRLRQDLPRLDVLINNAGAIFKERRETSDGFERTFALNHLSYFLLTHHLRPLLADSAPARIVNVASEAHRGAEIDFDDLQKEANYSGWRTYQMSKLANILFTAELAERLEGTGVTANCLHPGFVASRFGHDNGGAFALMLRLLQAVFAIDEEKGADTSVHLAASEEVEGISGKYFAKCRDKTPSPEACDVATRRRLWRVTEDLLADHLG